MNQHMDDVRCTTTRAAGSRRHTYRLARTLIIGDNCLAGNRRERPGPWEGAR